jgi:hypothetical protein
MVRVREARGCRGLILFLFEEGWERAGYAEGASGVHLGARAPCAPRSLRLAAAGQHEAGGITAADMKVERVPDLLVNPHIKKSDPGVTSRCLPHT